LSASGILIIPRTLLTLGGREKYAAWRRENKAILCSICSGSACGTKDSDD
jgi:hypothetical protein